LSILPEWRNYSIRRPGRMISARTLHAAKERKQMIQEKPATSACVPMCEWSGTLRPRRGMRDPARRTS